MFNRKMVVSVLSIATATTILWVAVSREVCGQDSEGGKPKWTQAEQNRGYVVFEYSTMSNLAPDHVPARDSIVTMLSCELARDEYESIQFGVHALDDIEVLEVNVESDLNVTVYHRINPSIKRQLASEPSEMGEVSGWIPSEVHLQRGNEFEVLDTGQSVNFWLTFHADTKTKAGLYQGKVRIKPAGKAQMVLDLVVSVRSLKLARPRIAFGMWLREDMLPKRFGGLSTPKESVLAIYRDIAAHGHNSAVYYPGGSFVELPPRNNYVLDKLVPLAHQAGLLDPNIPCLLLGGIPGDLEGDDLIKAVRWLQDECRKQGWPEMIVFGWDEPPFPSRSDEVRRSLAPMRGIPMRVNIDMSGSPAVYGYSTPGLCDVLTVMGEGVLSPEMRAEAERMGAALWTYSYATWREGFDPLRQRYFAGLFTWAHELGGNWIWAYHHGHHRHAWFPPESHEPMPVTGWEARREGIDDYRYLQMVEDCVAANPKKSMAREAAKWLESLRAQVSAIEPQDVKAGKPLALDEYVEFRDKATGYIQNLGPVPNEVAKRAPITQVKDEAIAYRGRSLEECIAGLSSTDVSERRAAAWALFEMGPKAAPATESLASALDDPDVRMPALHALEDIGPEAYLAVPKLAALLDHPDFYVRLGATFALAEIGCPFDKRVLGGRRAPSRWASIIVEPLAVAFQDDYARLSSEAAEILAVMGPLAKPVVSHAIRMLDDPSSTRRGSALVLISGLGPAAAQAVPKLTELNKNTPGDERFIYALAAIGPAAAPAVPALEAYAAKSNPGVRLVDTYYALVCIRGDVSDLRKMIDLLKNPQVNAATKNRVVKLLDQLGTKAEPLADEISRIVKSDKFTDENRKSSFGATSPAEARYVDGTDAVELTRKLVKIERLPVDGWKFKDDPTGIGVEQGYFASDYPSGDLPEIKIGQLWDGQGYPKLEQGWYRRQYSCPEIPEGKRVFLHFEAVDESVWLYIDGKLVAWYDTAFPDVTFSKPFLLDVTGSLKNHGTHLLAIRVHNYSGDGGIYRPVSLMVEK